MLSASIVRLSLLSSGRELLILMQFSSLNLRTCGTNQHDKQYSVEQYTKIHPSLPCNKTPVEIFLSFLRNICSQYTREAVKIKLFLATSRNRWLHGEQTDVSRTTEMVAKQGFIPLNPRESFRLYNKT